MKFALIKNGIVEQIQPNKDEGFVEVPDHAIPGMIVDNNGDLVAPVPTQEALNAKRADKINALLLDIDIKSMRSLRAKNLGRNKQLDDSTLLSLDDEANTLRDELITLQQITN